MGHSLDFYELSAQKKDSLKKEKWSQSTEVVDRIRVPYDVNIFYQQWLKGLTIGLKALSFLALFSKLSLPSSARRIFNQRPIKLLVDNQELITHGLLVNLLATTYLKEVDPRTLQINLHLHEQRPKTNFFFQVLPNSSEFTMLIEALSEMIVELGLESIGDLRLSSLGKGAKAFSDFRNLPKVFADVKFLIFRSNEFISCIRSLNRNSQNHHAITVYNRKLSLLLIAISYLAKDLAGALKYMGAFGGVAYLSSRVQLFSNIENLLGAALALRELVVMDIPGYRSARNHRERKRNLLLLVMHSGILFQSGLGEAAVKLAGRVTNSPTMLKITPRLNKAVALMTASCAFRLRCPVQRP